MKIRETKTHQTKSNNIKTNISNQVRSELPKMHSKYLKKFKGKHQLINKFIYVPDIINGGDSDNIDDFINNTCEVGQCLSIGNIRYTLIGLSLDRSMHLKFEYLFSDDDSGLCSIAHLIETTEGWKVKKIEVFD